MPITKVESTWDEYVPFQLLDSYFRVFFLPAHLTFWQEYTERSMESNISWCIN